MKRLQQKWEHLREERLWWVERFLDVDDLFEEWIQGRRFLVYGFYVLLVVVSCLILAGGIMQQDEFEAIGGVTLLGMDGLLLSGAFFLVVLL